MDVGKIEATSKSSSSKENGEPNSHSSENEQLKKRHQSGPSSCSSSPFEGDDFRSLASKIRVSLSRDKEEGHHDAFNGLKNASKTDSKPVQTVPTDSFQSERPLEKPHVPRITFDTAEEDFGISRSVGKREEKDELVPEEREILDELVQAINSDDFKRVMFIQNVVKEKNTVSFCRRFV